jgi:hypothetical protein
MFVQLGVVSGGSGKAKNDDVMYHHVDEQVVATSWDGLEHTQQCSLSSALDYLKVLGNKSKINQHDRNDR